MGHDAFERGYKRPSLRLHLIIFLTIIGVSVFLSSQVEKSKDKTRVEALKVPVPIDSVFVEEENRSEKPSVEAPKIAQASRITKESELEYQFDDGSSLARIDNMLAEIDGDAEENKAQGTTVSMDASADAGESTIDLPAKEDKANPPSQKEQDIAIMVTDDDVPSTNDETTKVSQVKEAETDLTPKTETSANDKNKTRKLGELDAVYELQQDRFLETLAKTAIVETKETQEVKRIKEAIRSDKPLNIKSSIKKESKSGEENSLIKVAATNTSGVIDSKGKSKSKTVVAKATPAAGKMTDKEKSLSQVVKQITLTTSELNNVLSQFARSYNKGDLNRLMALFDENAITNDQKNKLGIKAEYGELFSTTSHRTIKIRNVRWNLGKDKARGDAKFTVTVRPTGSTELAQIEGKIEIVAIKEDRGVYIKKLLHEITGQ